MSMWSRQERGISSLANTLTALGYPIRSRGMALASVSQETAKRHSAVWACLRIRADLISTFPVDVYRKVDGVSVEVRKPQVLVNPGGDHWPYIHWAWASQHDLDSAGNAIGLIRERDGMNLPALIELVPAHKCSVFQYKGMPTHRYRIDGTEYTPDQVWHERQYPVPGLPVGLSPTAYAAWTISESLSMQQFALDWFSGGAVPKARLRNTERTLEDDRSTGLNEARRVKDRYMATVNNGDVFVHGKDWELDFMQAQAAGTEWLEGRRFGLADVARFYGVPADLIDAAISAPGSITYQSALQRNLQFLIMNMEPVVVRREHAFSNGLVSRPRFVKLNHNSLLRMDPDTQAKVIHQRLQDKTMTNPEARALYDLPALTPEQIAEFEKLYGSGQKQRDLAETIQKVYLGVGKMITTDEAREIANAAGGDLEIRGPAFPATPVKQTGVPPA